MPASPLLESGGNLVVLWLPPGRGITQEAGSGMPAPRPLAPAAGGLAQSAVRGVGLRPVKGPPQEDSWNDNDGPGQLRGEKQFPSHPHPHPHPSSRRPLRRPQEQRGGGYPPWEPRSPQPPTPAASGDSESLTKRIPK